MITARQTTLYRVPDLAAFGRTLTDWIAGLPKQDAGHTFLLVPTRAAAAALRRTVEDRALSADRAALVWPVMGMRRDLYDELAARLPSPPPALSAVEREVILAAVARGLIDEGLTPPFQVRPGLVAEMLALYDHVRRLGRTVEDFERNFRAELEPEQDIDRGAARLLQQTDFLAAAFRGYQSRLQEDGRTDEHGLRELLLREPSARPLTRIIVTVADRVADPDGLWPADLDLLTRIPGLERLDLVCTESELGAGLLERLHAAFPDLAEERPAAATTPAPTLVVEMPDAGGAQPIVATFRDREEELEAVARRLKLDRRDGTGAPLHRTAIVVRRPLPYLYLARAVFADAAIPFETLDTLPLAAEPYAAALDLVLDAVSSDFSRTALVALLRTPHLDLAPPDASADAWEVSVAACDVALADAKYLGGFDRLAGLVAAWQGRDAPASREERRQQVALTAATSAVDAVRALRPLAEDRSITEHIGTLLDWLRRFDRAPDPRDATGSRRARARAAVLGALTALADAYRRHDPDARAEVAALTAAIRRWLGSRTFAAPTAQSGLQILDAQTARYGDFDDVQIVGLIEGEWPARVRRNVLYPTSLMALLEPLPALADPARRDRDALKSARAAFKDLVRSPSGRIRLSTFTLEHDAVVEPSILLDDVAGLQLPIERVGDRAARVAWSEALALEPRMAQVVPDLARPWAEARLDGDDRSIERFRGAAGPWRMPRVSISRLERYLDCPFRFFASEVLQIAEQPEDEDTRTPLERGRFLHELWERFFTEWQSRGYGRIEPALVPEARALFEELCEDALSRLPPSEAALERNRLLGSAVSPGIAHRVFALEAGRPTPISERLLEFPLQGDFTFRSKGGAEKLVTLSAKVDRIDVLADGSLRVIDYKSKKTPDLKQALQLPIYSQLARDSLRTSRGGDWTIAEALYLSFEGDKAVVSLRSRGRLLDELLEDAQDRLLTTLDRIAEGAFPPKPARKGLCGPCPYQSVCRLEIVDDSPEPNGD